jgi:hypothetical protein
MVFDWSLFIGTTTLIAIIVYFLRKIDSKIDSNAKDVNAIRVQIAALSGELSTTAVQIFNQICKERQSGCWLVHETRFKALEESDKHTCQKVSHLEAERKDSWREQKSWNERIEKKIFDK